MAETRYLYFAYGSNLWWPRMRQRCQTARAWGGATLDGYRLVERLYADIERRTGSHVQGVLYSVTAADIASASDERITAAHEVVHWVIGNPIVQMSPWTVTTAAGSVTVNGTCNGATTLVLYLERND